jgi:hypothetical protein
MPHIADVAAHLPLVVKIMVLLSIWLQRTVSSALFAVALACRGGCDSLLLTWSQIERVSLDFLDDVLLENFVLESPQRILHAQPNRIVSTAPGNSLGQITATRAPIGDSSFARQNQLALKLIF